MKSEFTKLFSLVRFQASPSFSAVRHNVLPFHRTSGWTCVRRRCDCLCKPPNYRGLRRLVEVFTYSKLAQAGIAAVSYLAAAAPENRLVGSAEIAESRELSRQLVAKVLTILSKHGLVTGTPGPSGGYRLARPSGEISLLDVVKVFEDPEDRVMCPFGPNWCGVGPHCPLHDTLIDMHEQTLDRLAAENFSQFEPPRHGHR